MINTDGCDRSRDINPGPAGRIAYLMIVDSDPVAHVGITHMLSGNSSLAIGACARTWREALAAARVTKPDLALAGLRPPDRAVRQLRDSVPAIKLVLFASETALRGPTVASADAIIPRDMGASGLADVLSRVIQGEQVLDIGVRNGITSNRQCPGKARRQESGGGGDLRQGDRAAVATAPRGGHHDGGAG